MDIDTENILKLISPNGVPESWKDNPDFYSYLSKLGNYNVEQLSKEPDHLNAEKAAILNQTQELAFANYKTFIRTAECSREIFKQFNKTEERLDSVAEGLPELRSRCEEFGRRWDEIKERRRVNTLCLTRHSGLLQTLELPQLMEALVRQNRYEQALQLAAYVRRLAKLHGSVPIIASISEEVEKYWSLLTRKLVGELGRELSLAKWLEVVSTLRRMAVLSDLELSIKFLQARDATLNAQLAQIPNQDGGQHLSGTIEVMRSHLFNTITQYKAVFSNSQEQVQPGIKSKFNEPPILQSWINEKVRQFVECVTSDLHRGVGGGGQLASLLGQCMYFGGSLSRVGCDPRSVLAPLFVAAILAPLKSTLASAAASFATNMDTFTLSPSASNTVGIAHQQNQSGAPACLLEFYPLACCCNDLSVGLNELRLCAPLALARQLTTLLNQTMKSVANRILLFYTREQQAMSKEERECLTRFCVCFADHFLPYIQRCVHQIYNPAEVAAFVGVAPNRLIAEVPGTAGLRPAWLLMMESTRSETSMQILTRCRRQRKWGLTYLEKESILSPIAELLPPKLEPPINIRQFSVPAVEEDIPAGHDQSTVEFSAVDKTEITT